jgi:hypothetical protein
MQQKYVWDIATSREFTKKQIRTLNQVCDVLSFGGDVKNLKVMLKELKTLSPNNA